MKTFKLVLVNCVLIDRFDFVTLQTMSDDEKRRFFELAQKDAERYQAEVAAYGGEDAMRKRKRVKKDPNAPKRALLVIIISGVKNYVFLSRIKLL